MKNKDERTERVTKAAQAELAKSGIVQFRVEPAILQRLYDMAHDKKVRLSTMLRDWIVEKLDQAADPAAATDMKGLYLMMREMQKEILELKNEKVSESRAPAYEFPMSQANDGIFGEPKKSITPEKTIVVVGGVIVPCTVDADGNPNADDIRNTLARAVSELPCGKSKSSGQKLKKTAK